MPGEIDGIIVPTGETGVKESLPSDKLGELRTFQENLRKSGAGVVAECIKVTDWGFTIRANPNLTSGVVSGEHLGMYYAIGDRDEASKYIDGLRVFQFAFGESDVRVSEYEYVKGDGPYGSGGEARIKVGGSRRARISEVSEALSVLDRQADAILADRKQNSVASVVVPTRPGA